jgi:hypothetical protein
VVVMSELFNDEVLIDLGFSNKKKHLCTIHASEILDTMVTWCPGFVEP